MKIPLTALRFLTPKKLGYAILTPGVYSSGHLVLSHLGLAFVLMLRPFFPELVISTDLLSFEHPSVLLFCFSMRMEKGHSSSFLES